MAIAALLACTGRVETIPREHKKCGLLKLLFIPLLQFSSSPLYTVCKPTDQLSSYKIDASTLAKAFSTRPGINKHNIDVNRYFWRRSLKTLDLHFDDKCTFL